MKRLLTLATLFSFLLLAQNRAAEPVNAANTAQAQKVLALVKEVQAQQLLIAENQTKIDNKIEVVAEQIRVARIYSSRGGK